MEITKLCFFYCRHTSLLENFNSKMLKYAPNKMPLSKYLIFFTKDLAVIVLQDISS